MVRRTKEDAERTRLQIIEAARKTFHQCGVSRTSLEKVAAAAGVTRGAVYWHFADKAALFFAMRENSLAVIDRADAFLFGDESGDPLDAIEQSMVYFFRTMSTCPAARETYEIMSFRCEYVDEFASVLQEVNRPCVEFQAKLTTAYQQALALGVMRPELDPDAMALDSVSFVRGLFNNWLASSPGTEWRDQVEDMIHTHVALRRITPPRA
ncbi:TetR family transcriptional regulator [Rhodocyclus tenuis]|uniref:TetR family transcriptional regulator n=1 Tax=Rhodocyclus gracilis TaxID=2929842 RepID=UPI001298A06E|nr:TetR family transcriptional regulator [Rhodocyclus gracilis]MRD72435.1 TetR family transcriptional regulator [Rhodocyclus gracilis]